MASDKLSTIHLGVSCNAPSGAGAYYLKIDLVSEGVSWFEQSGSPPAIHPLRVAE